VKNYRACMQQLSFLVTTTLSTFAPLNKNMQIEDENIEVLGARVHNLKKYRCKNTP
jgi:hypothetical protein